MRPVEDLPLPSERNTVAVWRNSGFQTPVTIGRRTDNWCCPLCLLLVVVVTGRTAWSNQASPANLSLLELPFALARDVDTFSRYQSMSESLARISRALDPIYRELALESLDDANRRIHTLADGLLIFEGTETWRLVYERLLRSPGLYQ